MQNRFRAYALMTMAAASLTVGACGRGNSNNANSGTAAGDVTPSPTANYGTSAPTAQYGAPTARDSTASHHSKLSGALVGAAAGHMLGHHALAGAAAGALIQHERNKHQR